MAAATVATDGQRVYAIFAKLHLIGEWYGIAVAHTVLALPFVVIVVGAGLRNFDLNLEMAARGLGAWIQQMLEEIGPEPPVQRPRRPTRRGLEVLDGGRT